MNTGFEPLGLGPPRAVRRATHLALFAPLLEAPATPASAAAEAAAQAAQRAAEAEAIRRDAFAAGYAAGAEAALASDAAAINAALERVPAALAALGAAARTAAGEAAQELAAAVFAAIDAALPGLAATRAPDAAEALAARIAPLLEFDVAIVLRAAPHLVDGIAARLGDPRITVQPDPSLPAGDLAATWQGGRAHYDLAARRAAIRTALAEAGLPMED